MAGVLPLPEQVLAAEIELALAYMRACNPPVYEVRAARRGDLCAAMAGMHAERAGNGLSGMSREQAEQRSGVTHADA